MSRCARFLLAIAVAASAFMGATTSEVGAAAPAASAGAVATSMPGAFSSVGPARLVDSRQSSPLAAGQSRTVRVSGRVGVPTSGVSAVVVNLTATRAVQSGYLSVIGGTRPSNATSSLNFVPSFDVANLAVVALQGSDSITVYSSARVDVVVDVVGWYASGEVSQPGGFATLTATRVLDTRTGRGAPRAPVASGHSVSQVTAGAFGIPDAPAVTAVIVNLTAVNASAAGHVTVHPGGTPVPATSNLNFSRGRPVAGLITAPVGADGAVTLTVSGGPVDLVADVLGYVLGGNTHTAGSTNVVAPDRVADTRTGLGVRAGKVPAGTVLSVPLAGRGGVPSGGVSAVALTITVTQGSAGGHITAFAHGGAVPATSNLNFAAGQDVGNTVIVPVGADGGIDLLSATGGTTQLVVDVVGWFRSTPPEDISPGNTQASGVSANLGETRLDPTTAAGVRQRWTAGNGDLRNTDVHYVITAGGVTYAQNVPKTGQLSAIDTRTGEVLWTRETLNGSIAVSDAVYTVDELSAPGQYRFLAFDKSDGHTVWSSDISALPGSFSDLRLDAGRLVFPTRHIETSDEITFVTLDARTGTDVKLLTVDANFDRSYGYDYADGRVFITDGDRGLRAFNMVDGSPLWSDPSAGDGEVHVASGRLYVDRFGAVASYDPAGCGGPICRPAWTTTAPAPPAPDERVAYSPAAITANMLAVEAASTTSGDPSEVLYYSAVTGQLIGRTTLTGTTNPHTPFITPGLVWVVINNKVVALPETCLSQCQIVKSYNAPPFAQPYLLVGGGTVLLNDVSQSGSAITALR